MAPKTTSPVGVVHPVVQTNHSVHGRWQGKKPAAFTLLEMLFVVFLIALIAQFAIPRLNELTTVNLKSAARQLAGLITFTFQRAVMTRQIHRLTLNFDDGSYWVEVYVPHTTKPENAQGETSTPVSDFQRTSGSLFRPGHLPRGVKLRRYYDPKRDAVQESGTAYIYFYPIGESNGGYLLLETDEKTAVTLRINPITGKVASQRGLPEDNNES